MFGGNFFWSRGFGSVVVFVALLFASGCDEDAMATFVFEKSLGMALGDACDEDEACLTALEEQLRPCIEQSPTFAEILANDMNTDDKVQMQKMSFEVIGCITDEDGQSYFASNSEEGE